MNSSLYDAYLPAMMWLQNHEADEPRKNSLLPSFPKFDSCVAVPGKSYQQLARDDLSIFAECKSYKPISEEHSSPKVRKSSGKTCDELFLPSETKSQGNTKAPLHSAGQFVQRHMHLAQRLPKTGKPINALPACLVAGLQPPRTFWSSPAGSKSRDQRPDAFGAPACFPKKIQKTAESQGGTSSLDAERANLTPPKLHAGRRRSSVQTFDSVQFAQVPSDYDLRRQADNQDLQVHISSSSRIPPLRVVSPLRLPGIFPASPVCSLTPEVIPRSSRVGLPQRKDIPKIVELRRENSGYLDEGADRTLPERHTGQRRCSTKKVHPVRFAQIHSHYNFGKHKASQELQANKSLSPEIPPLRPVSAFRISGIFPTSLGSSDAPSGSLRASDIHPPKRVPKVEAFTAEFPSSLDGSNDVAPLDRETRPSPGRSNVSSHDTFPRRIRRRKGYENLRMASKSHTIPPLPVTSPLAFPDFSFDM